MYLRVVAQLLSRVNARGPMLAGSAITALTIAGLAAPAQAGGSIPKEAGVWIDDTGKGAVKIEPCGAKLCGRIVWLRDPLNAKGEPLTDKNNPDSSMHVRPICGLPTLGDLSAMPEGGFDNGWVYDPKVGMSYSVALDLVGADQLQVTGYKGVRFLGKSFIWTRAKTELPSCAPTTAATRPAPAAGASAKAAVKKPADAKAAGVKSAETLPWDTAKAPAAPKPAAQKAAGQKAPAQAVPDASASKLGAAKLNTPAQTPTAKLSAWPPVIE